MTEQHDFISDYYGELGVWMAAKTIDIMAEPEKPVGIVWIQEGSVEEIARSYAVTAR